MITYNKDGLVHFRQYKIERNGTILWPAVFDGEWLLWSETGCWGLTTFRNIVRLYQIPEQDAIIFKLKYGI